MHRLPSIFNDVVGPVMRGPSSSHSAAALRIGRICRELMNGDPGRVVVRYDSQDALATTHKSQGSDMGLKGGLLGFDADDIRLLEPDEHLERAGITVDIEVENTAYSLPNLYLLELNNKVEQVRVAAISTGGGMIEVIEIDGTNVSIRGDYHEVLIYTGDKMLLETPALKVPWADQVIVNEGSAPFIQVKSSKIPEQGWLNKMQKRASLDSVKVISPVLPVLSRRDINIPFKNASQLLQYDENRNLTARELAVRYESERSGMKDEQVVAVMTGLYHVMRGAVENGLNGTDYKDRLLGAQSPAYLKSRKAGLLAGGEALHNITMYVSAIMETKSSMGTIVAAPTAGSCGTFPGAVLGVADSLGLGENQIVEALLAGSLVGLFIASGSTFSAEIGGCQAECGSASGMAAAAIAALLGGSTEQCLAAASMALQNSLGMICDPIAARVEAPCLGKNVSAAANALTCANMVMAGYDPLIPLDEVIETMDRVGKSLPRELRCTALGGLSLTPTARKLEKKLGK